MRSFRFWIAFAGSAVALASVLLILGVWLKHWRLGLPASADELTRINTIVAASAYGAAILAVVFALVAYWQASGRPNLAPEITFTGLRQGELSFTATKRQLPPWVDLGAPPLVGVGVPLPVLAMLDRPSPDLATVILKNRTKYAARNPGVRIEFDGLLFGGGGAGWTVVERWGELNGLGKIQWDGGTENIVHGKWERILPVLMFNETVITRANPPPALIITVVSDGCDPKEFPFPLDIVIIDEP